jgi:hypothetical protein
MKTTKNNATKNELINQINEFKNIVSKSNGVEKTLFTKLLVKAEMDLNTGNYNN